MNRFLNFKKLPLVTLAVLSVITFSHVRPAQADFTPEATGSALLFGAGALQLGGVPIPMIIDPYVTWTNGSSVLGVKAYIPLGDNIAVRVGVSPGFNGALTYSLNDRHSQVSPFIGVGLGSKTISQTVTSRDTNASSVYGTVGVDIRPFDNDIFSVTGAVNLPTNSAYGTEFQVGVRGLLFR